MPSTTPNDKSMSGFTDVSNFIKSQTNPQNWAVVKISYEPVWHILVKMIKNLSTANNNYSPAFKKAFLGRYTNDELDIFLANMDFFYVKDSIKLVDKSGNPLNTPITNILRTSSGTDDEGTGRGTYYVPSLLLRSLHFDEKQKEWSLKQLEPNGVSSTDGNWRGSSNNGACTFELPDKSNWGERDLPNQIFNYVPQTVNDQWKQNFGYNISTAPYGNLTSGNDENAALGAHNCNSSWNALHSDAKDTSLAQNTIGMGRMDSWNWVDLWKQNPKLLTKKTKKN